MFPMVPGDTDLNETVFRDGTDTTDGKVSDEIHPVLNIVSRRDSLLEFISVTV